MYLLKSVLITFFVLAFCQGVYAQPKTKKTLTPKNITTSIKLHEPTFELDINGDTINCTDKYALKQGKWIIEKKSRYEDWSSREVGKYIHGEKYGEWKKYEGSKIVSIESYKQDKLNGACRYYEDGLLVCEGNYYGLVGTGKMDTVFVVNPITDELKRFIIPTEKKSVKEGKWTYYYTSGKIMRIDLWLMDEMISTTSFDEFTIDSTFINNYIYNLPSSGNVKTEVPFGNKNVTVPRFGKVEGEKKFVMPAFGKQEKIKKR
jgi:antitoxin component YwqK of YwqJK toxin-antitoxin module